MPSFFKSCEECFGSKDLYEILQIEKTATEKELKKAYYKLSLAIHPDRAPEEKKAHATKCFQVLGKIMSVLSDKDKKNIYDETGTVSEDDDEGVAWGDRDWTAYWRLLFKPISVKDVENFFASYIGSDEEKTDVLVCYAKAKGDWDVMYQTHKGYRGIDDEERILEMVQEAVDDGEAESYPAFFKEPKKKKERRHKRMMKEAEEAAANGENTEEDLAVLLRQNAQKRQRDMSSFFDQLEAKYGGKEAKTGKGSKKAKK